MISPDVSGQLRGAGLRVTASRQAVLQWWAEHPHATAEQVRSGVAQRLGSAAQADDDDAGIPVASDEHSLTVGPDGPILLQDHYLIEQMAQFNRERTTRPAGGW